MSVTNDENQGHRPLEGIPRTVLAAAAAAIVTLGFALTAAAAVVFLGWLLVALVVAAIALRLGAWGWARDFFENEWRTARVYADAISLRRRKQRATLLSQRDAPDLWALTEELARHCRIRPPDSIAPCGGMSAAIELPPALPGRVPHTKIWVGYDFLAALTRDHCRAVMAHEMAHALLVKRGLNRYINSGVAHAVSVAAASGELCDRLNGRPPISASLLHFIARPLALWATRVYAAYSRQDEFDADRLAATLTGPAACRDALLRISVA